MICKTCKHLVKAADERFDAFRTYQCSAELPSDLPIPGHMRRLLQEVEMEKSRPAFAWFSPSSVIDCRVYEPKEVA